MSITFLNGADLLTLPDPAPGYPVRAVRRQAIGRTAGGAVYVYDKGVDTFEVDLPFESLSSTEKVALSDFFDSVIQGCLKTFTYTDSNGVAHTARFIMPRLEFTKVSANVWDVRCPLELDSMGG